MKNVINKRHTTKCFVVVNAYEAATNFSIDRESTNNVSIYVHYHKRSKLGKVLKSEWYSYSLYPFIETLYISAARYNKKMVWFNKILLRHLLIFV